MGTDRRARGRRSAGRSCQRRGARVIAAVVAVTLAVGLGVARSTPALAANGTVDAWGYNNLGQIGDGTSGTDRLYPVALGSPLTSVSHIFAHLHSTYAIASGGHVYGWGQDNNGQLGDNTTDTTPNPSPIEVHGVANAGFLGDTTAIASGDAGNNAAYAIDTSGNLYAWGSNAKGQLGDNTITQRTTPVQVHGVGDVGFITNAKQVAGGGGWAMELDTTGAVYAWGDNTTGQIGQGASGGTYHTPVAVKGLGGVGTLTGVAAIAAGVGYGMALMNSGAVYVWGDNTNGQLGDGGTTEVDAPESLKGVGGVGTMANVAGIATQAASSYAVDTSHNVYAWGAGLNGQLGLNGTSDSLSVQQVHGVGNVGFLTGVAQVSAGQNHAVFRMTNGDVYDTGDNGGGEMGVNKTSAQLAQTLTPLQVLSTTGSGTLSNAIEVAAEQSSTLALIAAAGCSAGGLNLTAPASLTFPAVALSGLDSTATTTVVLTPDDETGSGSGWQLDAQASTFTSGGNTLPAAMVSAGSAAAAGGNCSMPSNAVSYGTPIVLPTTGSIKVFNATAGSGEGPANVTLTVQVPVPADSFAGTYTATWVFTIATPP